MFGGRVWPVVQRELRATARWRGSRWLRVGGALGGVIVFCSVSADVPFAELGTELFASVHLLLLFLICAIVPALTADCIARERREGTLGLLFLTPLTASGVVVGKILAQVLRALTVWLAVVPVLAIAFLFGGITWADMAGFLVIELCAGLLCLAAGVLASSLTESRPIAFILAFLLTAAFVSGSNRYMHWNIRRYARPVMWPGYRGRPSSRIVFMTGFPPATPVMQYQIATGRTVKRVTPGGRPLASRLPSPGILAEDFAFASIVLLVAIRIAGFCVERSWQDKIPSRRRQNWVRRCSTPLFRCWFARRMRRTLEWNPMAWLQQYSWRARLSKWGLCLLFVLMECAIIDPAGPDALAGMVDALFLVLAAAYTFAGVNSFLTDKRSGALELILVSPLSVKQIIFGRAWGLWKQFLPATLVLLASNILVHFMIPAGRYFGYYPGAAWNDSWFWLEDLEIAAIFLMLPVFASCIALRAKNLFVASALTWAAVLFGPAAGLLVFLPLQNTAASLFGVMVGQGYSAFLAYTLLRQGLERRSYSY
jgi:ABC-type Na+ efflux pump permease subunit